MHYYYKDCNVCWLQCDAIVTTAVISFYQGKGKHSCHRESYAQIKIKLFDSWSFGDRFIIFSLRWSTWEMPRKHTAHRTRRVHIGKYISVIFSMASKEVTKPAGQNGSWEKRGLVRSVEIIVRISNPSGLWACRPYNLRIWNHIYVLSNAQVIGSTGSQATWIRYPHNYLN